MPLRTLSAARAAALDQDLLSSGGFSLDQLMELAGLAVAQAVHRLHPASSSQPILLVCGPGNNGGDGLVAARHLRHAGHRPIVHYPKPTRSSSSNELFPRLCAQLHALDVPFASDFDAALAEAGHVVDAVFGFGFKGEVREPWRRVVAALETTSVPVTSVDVPSSWGVETGPPAEGRLGSRFRPAALVSLTAPKPLVEHFTGRHFVGGRFLSQAMADKYEVDVPPYRDVEQVVEIGRDGERL